MAKMFALNLAIMVSFGKRILSDNQAYRNGNMNAMHKGKSVEAGGGSGRKCDFKAIEG